MKSIRERAIYNETNLPTTPEELANARASRWQNKNKKYVAVNAHGGKCAVCGYNKNVAALDFHHVNPNDKEYQRTINGNMISMGLKEANKCVLLCANCHREHHHGGIKY